MTQTAKTILALGEVLWDVFPDGPRFGGAPANFACACSALGNRSVRVHLASAVGKDELGRKALNQLQQHDVSTSLIYECDFETGQVIVTLNHDGKASYRFIDEPAWYHVPSTESLTAAATQADVLCFGTLGQWSNVSRMAIQHALHVADHNAIRIFDINLRPPFYSRDTILESLSNANVLKLNDEELPILASMLDLSGNEHELLDGIWNRYPLRLVALTKGANGAMLVNTSRERFVSSGIAVDVVDTVGAGDAFTAALAVGLANEMPLDRIVDWACSVAAYVCTQSGGTPTIPGEHCLRPNT
ncbi:MAG: carbohydrate kinase [Pirellula sp.]